MKPESQKRLIAADAKVVQVDPICRDHVRIELTAPDFPASAPGQFLELRCNQEFESWQRALSWTEGSFPPFSDPSWHGRVPYLRRPFSIADQYEVDGVPRVAVISRKIGPGTDYLDHLRPNTTLNISGPLGIGFRIPEVGRPLLLVGGGVGIPPLLYLSRVLWAQGHRDVCAIFGAMSRDLFPVALRQEPARDAEPSRCLTLPGDAAFSALVTTDDGTLGMRGRVTDAIATFATHLKSPIVFACGPDRMLHALARLTRERGWDCQLCIEKNMGCGVGTCLSCVTRVVDTAKPNGWRWALTCSDGPVFDRDQLVEFAERSIT